MYVNILPHKHTQRKSLLLLLVFCIASTLRPNSECILYTTRLMLVAVFSLLECAFLFIFTISIHRYFVYLCFLSVFFFISYIFGFIGKKLIFRRGSRSVGNSFQSGAQVFQRMNYLSIVFRLCLRNAVISNEIFDCFLCCLAMLLNSIISEKRKWEHSLFASRLCRFKEKLNDTNW